MGSFIGDKRDDKLRHLFLEYIFFTEKLHRTDYLEALDVHRRMVLK
jgi:hypothetical protein